MTHKRVTKPGDISTIVEAISWDSRGGRQARAQKAFGNIRREFSALRKSVKEWEQKYSELMRMQETYVKQLHAAERERDEACQKEREGCARICDLEFAVNWHSSAMAAANSAKRCAELIRKQEKP